MSIHPVGTVSLAASLTGSVALLWDVATLVGSSGSSPTLDTVFTAANVVGFLLGAVSSRSSGHGAAGLHLSWVPLTAVLVALAAYRPVTAAALVRAFGGALVDVFDGLADFVTVVTT